LNLLRGLVIAVRSKAATIRLENGVEKDGPIGNIVRFGDEVLVAFDFENNRIRCIYPKEGTEAEDMCHIEQEVKKIAEEEQNSKRMGDWLVRCAQSLYPVC